MEKEKTPLTIRERIVFVLVLFLIRMIKPWQYDHQFDNFWAELKNVANGGDFTVIKK
jgi:hypothetical protein